jgi:hypothetical protein
VLVGSSRIDVLLTGIAFADATFQAAIAVVHFRVRRRPATGASEPPTRFAPPVVTALFFAIELGIAVGCLVRAPVQSAYGALALGVGAVVFYAWRRA